MEILLDKKQAAGFMLLKHGLAGPKRYKGQEGVLKLTCDLGCVQYDPVSISARSSELFYLSRVQFYKPSMLNSLLYEKRRLVDYFDKCMCIIPIEDLKYFRRTMEGYKHYKTSREEIEKLKPAVMKAALESEYIQPSDLGIKDRLKWFWGDTTAARAAVERLYFEGELAIHHKKGTVRYYCIPEKTGVGEYYTAPDPISDDTEHFKWRLLRRARSFGLLSLRRSDAYLGIHGMSGGQRGRLLNELADEGKLIPVSLEGSRYYITESDRAFLEAVLNGHMKTDARCELIAPLDNFMWDRRLISELFGFDYKWEIYTPAHLRRYGSYVLPVLYRDRLAARAMPSSDRKTGILSLEGFWREDWFEPSEGFKKAFFASLNRLAGICGCREVDIKCSI